jgi:hypothetical protein
MHNAFTWRDFVDPYIDYHEAVQYGRFFYQNVTPLIGASDVFNVEALRQVVLRAVDAVEAGLTVSDTPKTVVRAGRGTVETFSEEMADRLRRFYYYLLSLPASANVDVAAFFADGKQGKLSQYKAEDMLSRADTALRGFTTPAGATVPNGTAWQADIVVARGSLANALEGKLGAANTASTSVGSLAQARTEFLHVYNRVAKPAIRGLLAQLGREDEFRIYFRDLQVNEDRARPGAPTEPGADPGTAPIGDDPSEIAP